MSYIQPHFKHITWDSKGKEDSNLRGLYCNIHDCNKREEYESLKKFSINSCEIGSIPTFILVSRAWYTGNGLMVRYKLGDSSRKAFCRMSESEADKILHQLACGFGCDVTKLGSDTDKFHKPVFISYYL